jgi:hypothetical protein
VRSSESSCSAFKIPLACWFPSRHRAQDWGDWPEADSVNLPLDSTRGRSSDAQKREAISIPASNASSLVGTGSTDEGSQSSCTIPERWTARSNTLGAFSIDSPGRTI